MDEVGPVEDQAGAPTERAQRVQRAVDQWVSQLIDLTGRNQLLYYKTLKRGTLELTDAEPNRLDALLAGTKTRLSQLLPASSEDPQRFEDTRRRAQTLHRKARELFEERGIQALYVAWGMATWSTDSSTATPAAPVLLSPVRLESPGAAETDFNLVLDGDWEVNASLLHLLSVEFGVHIDPETLNSLLDQPTTGAPDPSELCDHLVKQADDIPDFETVPRIVLGTFSYMKLPMVQDLQAQAEELTEHDLVAAMAGVEEAREAIRARHAKDVDPSDPDHTPPADEHLVLDADASQSYVINAAVAGEPLVVQGPPGTGKSQTIANLLTTFAARGKRVLFVAEKRAAIDAVTKRLDEVGLSELVFDLHGGTRSKRQLAQDLAHSLDGIGNVAAPDLGGLHHELETTRARLAEYNDALHTRREPWGLSLWQMQEQLLAFGEDVPVLGGWTGEQLKQLDAETVRQVGSWLDEWQGLARPFFEETTPWVHVRAGAVTGEQDAHDAFDRVSQLSQVLPRVQSSLDKVLEETGLSCPDTVTEWEDLLDFLDSVVETETHFDSSVWDEDLGELASGLDPSRPRLLGRGWAHLTNRAYRVTKETALRYWHADRKPSGAELRARVQAAGLELAEWTAAGGSHPPEVPDSLAEARKSYADLFAALDSLERVLPIDQLKGMSHRELQGPVAALLEQQDVLFRLPRLNQLEQQLQAHHCHHLLDGVRQGRVRVQSLRAVFDRTWLESVRRQIVAADSRLAAFDGDLQRQRAEEFIAAEQQHLETAPERVRRLVAEQAVAARDDYPKQDQVMSKQARLKRGHMPLRQLVETAPDVLTALRPCWVMSPLVVSQALPRRKLFDVVIFDEASQIQPADAVPALSRADQVVVAGDHKQLPPTQFFDTTVDDDEEPEDEAALTTGFESILDVLGVCLRQWMLRWHYRSEDERLIAFSNQHLYEGALTTFPGIAGQECLDFDAVAHRPGTRTDSRSNDDEVDRVVELMIDHAHQRPLDSLGVIALGIHHANRVDARLRQRLEEIGDPELEDFFDESYEDRTFIKNLERVQGDERDAIILSTGYAKKPDGTLNYHFGPINQDGGERRLNVAITRARRKLTLVSSFSHTDMPPSKGSRGAQLLRSYLKYVASGGTDLEGAEAKTPLNAFELSVKDHLEQAGLEVIPQYGTSGYRIDFAVIHPTEPGRMILAIEADGASYHSSPTARDRDRLRQQVLERLGWRFHRIWSTDWFNNPEAETQKVVDAYHAALAADEADEAWDDAGGWDEWDDGDDGESVDTTMMTSQPAQRGPRPSVPSGKKIHEYSHRQLVRMAQWVMSDTLLRTDEELLVEVMEELGFQKRGKRIVAALDAAIRDVKKRPASSGGGAG